MDRRGIVLVLVIGLISGILFFDHVAVASSETALTNLEEIDQQLLSLLKSKQYEQLDSKIMAYMRSYEGDPLREKYVNVALEVFSRNLPSLEPSLTEWISKQPTSYTAHAARGIYYVRVGGTKRGSKFINQTTKKQLEGMTLYFDKALRDLDKAYSINHRLIQALCYEMVILRAYGLHDQLRRLRDKGLAVNPSSSWLRWTYISSLLPRWGGSIEEMREEIESARPYFTKNPDLKGIEGRISAEYGDYAFWQGNYQKAIRFYDEALRYGDASSYRFQRGVAHSRIKQFDPCIKDMDIAIQLRPNNPDAYYQRGYAKHRLQRYNEAIVDFSKSIDDDPYGDGAFFYRGNAHSFFGNYDLALADFEKAVTLSPDNSNYVYARDATKKLVQAKTK
jgi:tetratricopeptide (TPR) repeat protein